MTARPLLAPRSGILTFLIADIRGYTAFTGSAGDEAAARLAARFAEIMREGVEAEDGRVVELRGDEALCVFGSARQAQRAAVALQGVFADEVALDPTLPLRVGIGLDAGEAVPVEDGYRGAALNLAARLCATAGPGETIASDSVVHLAGTVDGLVAEERGAIELKGLGAPVTAHLVRARLAPPPAAPRRDATDPPPELDPIGPIIGRDREARGLRWSWRLARHAPARTTVIAGPAGVGKTRLAAEVAALAAHDGASIAYASGSREPGSIVLALRDIGSREGPLLVVLDDLDAAADADLAAVAALAETLAGRPALTVAISADGAPPAAERLLQRLASAGETISLGRLDEADVGRILDLYASDASGPLPVQAVAQASDGNPERAHVLAAEWAQSEFARRLDGAASRAATGRRDLRKLEAEVTSNLVDLQLARERLTLLKNGPTSDARAQACPFMGLNSFDVGDADLFFGRERLVAEMVGRLAGAPFLGVVGPSGSGKSSAVRAGLVPAIASGALSGGSSWALAVLRPGSDPMRELDRAVFAALDPGQRAALRTGDDPIAAALAVLPPDRRLLVVIDQFEEIFTSIRDPAERLAFVDAIVASTHSGRAVVVVAVRADFYGRCAEHPELAAWLAANHVLVGPMAADEYRRAIEGPARRAGLRVEPGLVDQLVTDVIDQPGGLPLLSTALVELWEKRTGRWMRSATYEATGGIRGAVGRMAESAYSRLSEAQQAIARSVFLRLASGEGDTVVGRRVSLAEFDASTNADVAQTLDVLTDARLLSVDAGTVAVSHEALFREWPRLVGWLDDDREGRRLRGHVAEAAREWDAGGRDAGELYRGARLASTLDWTTSHTLELNELERSFIAASRSASETEARRQRATNRRLRVLLGAAAVALVVAVGAGLFAVVQSRQAGQAATAADAQRLGAQALVAGSLDQSLLLARQGTALDDSIPTRANLLAALGRSPAAIRLARPLPDHLSWVQSSGDGRTLLVIDFSRHAAVLDPVTLAYRWFYTMGDEDAFLTLGDDGTLVVMRGEYGNRSLAFFDANDGHPTGTFTYPLEAGRVYWTPDLRSAVWLSHDGQTLTVADMATLAVQRTLHPPDGWTFGDVTAYAGGYLSTLLFQGPFPSDPNAVYDQAGRIGWWGPTGDRPISAVDVDNLGLAYVPSPNHAVMALDNIPSDGHETLVELATGETRALEGQHNSYIAGSNFSADGSTLVTAGDDSVALVWDVASGSLKETLRGHSGGLRGVALSSLGNNLTAFTGGLDSAVIAWDLTGDRRLARPFTAASGLVGIPDEIEPKPSVDLSPDGRLLAVNGIQGIDVLDVPAGGAITVHITIFVEFEAVAPSARFSPDRKLLAVTGSGDHILELYDTTSWTSTHGPLVGPSTDRSPVGESSRSANFARSVAFSPDSQHVTVGTEDGEVWTWDVATGAVIGPPLRVGGPVSALSYDAANGWLAVAWDELHEPRATDSGWASVYAPGETSARYSVSVDDKGQAQAVAFSPDGKLLATGGGAGDVRFWDATTGGEIGPPVAAVGGWVLDLDWTADGHSLVSSGTDGSVKLIDVASRAVVGTMPGYDQLWVGAAASPDGRHVYARYETGQGFDWIVDHTAWDAQACVTAGRTLTTAEWEQYLPTRPYDPACATPGG